jgi:hypothetical protein
MRCRPSILKTVVIFWRLFMKKQDFIDRLYAAGWDSFADGQHSRIEEFWKDLFPVVAELEGELEEAEMEIRCIGERD